MEEVEARDTAYLIGKLYEASLSGTHPWQAMVQDLVAAVGARTGWLILSPSDGGVPSIPGSVGAGMDAIKAYSEHYWAKDPWLSGVMSLSPGEVFASHAHVDAATFSHTEIFADYVRPHFGDTTWALAASLPVAGGATATIGVHRLRVSGAFGDPEVERFQQLVPHLRQALLLRHRIGDLLEDRDHALGVLSTLQTITGSAAMAG